MNCNCCSIDECILNICKNEYCYFLHKPNVIGVGLGYKFKNGFYTCDKSIVVLVTQKLPENQLCPQDKVPTLYKGIQTDVIQSSIIQTASLTQKIRPAKGGYSVGPATIKEEVGSIACLVTDGHSKYVLGNNHVLADGNHARINIPIIQPSRYDGGSAGADAIASLSGYSKIQFKTLTHSPDNYVDCAMAKLINPNMATPEIAFLGKPHGISRVQLTQNVQKVGRSTELTHGKVRLLGATIETQLKRGTALFKDQIATTKMTDFGDSGALLMDYIGFAVGLFFAQTNSYSYYNRIDYVLDALNVNIVTH